MNSWFDITGMDSEDFSYNFEDIKKSSKMVEKVIEEEQKVVQDYKSFFIGGFSQGAIVTSHLGASYGHLLGGVIACSGFIPRETEINQPNLKLLVTNGTHDDLIDFTKAKQSYERDPKLINLQFHPMKNQGHTIDSQSIELIRKFLQQ